MSRETLNYIIDTPSSTRSTEGSIETNSTDEKEPSNKYIDPPLTSILIYDVSHTYQPIQKLSYKTVDMVLRNIYGTKESYGSTALDILAVYLRGQKILYTEAKTSCENRLNTIMLPAILVSAITTVLSLALKDINQGPLILASLNAFSSFLLALISYFKLDARSEAHKTAAYKFDKLQSKCEFSSGKLLFFSTEEDDVRKIIEQVETQVEEIKETNQFVLPEFIRFSFPKLYTTNIFTKVKIIMNQEITLINTIKKYMNRNIELEREIAIFEENIVILKGNRIDRVKTSKQLSEIDYIDDNIKELTDKLSIKNNERQIVQTKLNTAITEFVLFRNKYLEDDKSINEEINKYIQRQKKRNEYCSFCSAI